MTAKRTAILVDGSFYLRHTLKEYGNMAPREAARLLSYIADAHLVREDGTVKDDLVRIYFYDCEPLAREITNPISKVTVNTADQAHNRWRNDYFEAIKGEYKVMLRLGRLQSMDEWTIRKERMVELINREIGVEDLTADDVSLVSRQKGVDVQIGMDMTRIALKGMVDKIVLIASDGDFVPVVQLAREEGLEVIVDNMNQKICRPLFENVDGLRTPAAEPIKARLRQSRNERTPPRQGTLASAFTAAGVRPGGSKEADVIEPGSNF